MVNYNFRLTDIVVATLTLMYDIVIIKITDEMKVTQPYNALTQKVEDPSDLSVLFTTVSLQVLDNITVNLNVLYYNMVPSI